MEHPSISYLFLFGNPYKIVTELLISECLPKSVQYKPHMRLPVHGKKIDLKFENE